MAFCVVLPEQIGNAFTQQALNMGWHLRLRTDVAENEARLPHRVLLTFSPQAGECFSDRLVIRGSDQHYSESYTALTRHFICLCEALTAKGSMGLIQPVVADNPA